MSNNSRFKLKFRRRIYIIIGIVIVLSGLFLLGYRHFSFYQLPIKRILVLHSYASDNPRCLYMNNLLEKELRQRGVRAEYTYRYMDVERKNYKQRYKWCNDLLDSISGNHPDIILINDDYALTFYLQCGHPLVGKLPTAFVGVYQPELIIDSLKKFPNITGKWERVDYQANVHFIEKIFKKHVAITAYYETTVMSKQAYKQIHEQVKGARNIRLNHYYLHQIETDSSQFPADEELFGTLQEWGRQDIPYPFSVVTFRPYRNLKGVAIVGQSGDIFTQEYFLNDLYGIITIPLGFSHISPTFTVINEPFGFWNAYLGGYFTTCEQQIADEADLAVQILKGVSPANIPITESAKEYVIDWRTLDRFNINKDSLPPEARLVNMPFYERYKVWIFVVGFTLIFSFLSFLSYVIYLYFREQRRTREALNNIMRKNTSLELAIQGGNTYVWRFCNNEFFFEHVVGNLPQKMKLEELRELIHQDDLPTFDNVRGFLHNMGKKIQYYRCKFTGPEYEWWEFRFNTIGTEKNEEYEVSGLLINVQAVKDKEEELVQARKLAEKAELKQSFIANMSHEIRTPLNSIVGFSNLLVVEKDLDESEKNEFVETINRNSDLLLVLINDILELSRIDSEQISFAKVEYSVLELVDNLYSTHRVLIPPQLQFLKEVPEISLTIYTDISRISQVITNFLTNARKFTPNGYIKLGFEYLKKTNEVSIFVEDSGIGVSKEQQKMIFSRFYKNDEFAQGTGLGLSICEAIVERLGGRITLESEQGKGSRFAVVLPCV